MSMRIAGSTSPMIERPDQVDAVVERRDLHDQLEQRRVDGDREERAAEQEHRQHDELDQVEVLPACA